MNAEKTPSQPLSVSELAARIKAETGVRVQMNAIHSWVTKGCRGKKLPAQFVGGHRFIRWEDYQEFSRALNEAAPISAAPEVVTGLDLGGRGGFSQPMM